MKLEENCIYHIYNRGNQQQKIFFCAENYYYFLRKIQKEIAPHCNFLAYCLMPNHFHFLLEVPEGSGRTTSSRPTTSLNRKIGTLLSSYTRALQKQEKFTGSLFQQQTKSVEIINELQMKICTNYIHYNPVKAGFVKKMESWRFSSFNGLVNPKSKSFCNSQRLRHLLELNEMDNFYNSSYQHLLEEHFKDILLDH